MQTVMRWVNNHTDILKLFQAICLPANLHVKLYSLHMSKNRLETLNVMLFSIQGERKQKGKLECFSQLGGKERARLLNKMSRAIFPASFLVFNMIDWLVYMLMEPSPIV